ncbi:MAG: glycoside hydrolase family 57 protein [Trueperaceae bacterium]|nr:glycoside hydrolase family 57 protein [Trueperaceae bacterium]
MQLSHLTPDTPRRPVRVSPDERVEMVLATSPVGAHQSVWIDYRVQAPRHGTTTHADPSDDSTVGRRVPGRWTHNEGDTSYWQAFLGPFPRGARVTYEPWATAPEGDAQAPPASFRVGTRLHVALLWHQHQPLYRDPDQPIGRGSYRQPWVRLHGIRDYYAMAHLVAEHPAVHLTINLTPVLLEQLDDYLERGATDRALDLTLARAEDLDDAATGEILSTFFDADWHQQIYPYDRYHALLDMRQAGRPFRAQDVRDLQMWFNLAWFAPEFHEGTVELPGGATASVRDLVLQGRDYRHEQLQAMMDEQYKVLRAIVPIHRRLQDAGQIEVSTTPYHHPILPLLIDTDRATIDRPGTEHPPRFAYPEDARAQTAAAIEAYQRRFGRRPRGMWPAEGAVSEDAATIFAEARVRWIASDQGVLQRSGRWGYRSDDPNVLCRPYRVVTAAGDVSIFFRDTALSNDIGFHYQSYGDAWAAAQDFLRQVRERVAHRIDDPDHERVLTIALDGENAWGAYREAARPFLHALYTALEQADDLATVTFSECLDGAPDRVLDGHPSDVQARVHDLFTGSWIDEPGSAPGVDLGTWIGENEENRAWRLLGDARRALVVADVTPRSHPDAYRALYAAEGSDWFWWLGDTQDSGHDADFDALFRGHLVRAYREAGLTPPDALRTVLTPETLVWTFAGPVRSLPIGVRLTVRTNCPGGLRWRFAEGPTSTTMLTPVGGAMAGVRHHDAPLGPFEEPGRLAFTFLCGHDDCPRSAACCRPEERVVMVTPQPD